MTQVIKSFQGPYRFLSNFWPVQIPGKELVYPSAEHAYQAAKCVDRSQRILFSLGTAGEAKKIGRTIKIRPDWNQVKLQIMEQILRKKFAPGTALAIQLLETGDTTLIEGNMWHDNYWGRCDCSRCQEKTWHNHLGYLLMATRYSLRAQQCIT